jgi:hypothetical protein
MIGGTTESITCRERTQGGDIQHQCSTRSEVRWVEGGAVSALVGGSSLGVDQSQAASQGGTQPLSSGSPTGGASYTVLEDELMARFKAKHGPNYDSMALKGVSVIASDVRIGEKISSLPTSVSEENYVAKNDTSTAQTRHFVVSVSAVDRERYEFSKSVVSGTRLTGELSFEIKAGDLTLGGSGTSERTRTLTLGNTRETTRETTRSYEENFDQTVQPRTVLFIKVQRESRNDIYKLEGGILFDGDVDVVHRWKDVYACGAFGTDRCHRWKERTDKYKLSQLLPAEQRRFELDGRVTVSSAANTSTVVTYAETPLSSLHTVQDTELPIVAPRLDPARDYYRVAAPPPNLRYRPVASRPCGAGAAC